MTLDVVVCTYNRSALLRKAVESLLCAPVPPGLSINLYVADNNSPDDTAAIVRALQTSAALPLHYLCETLQGSSHARNAGIAAGNGEIVGLIDDDEEVAPDWYQVIAREFQDPAVQFIGGPCLPNWQAPAPDWLPPGYHSVIGAIPPKPRGRYGDGHPGMLNGGNAVLRRSVFERVGGFSTRLGRTPQGLLSEEDVELFRRIMDAGISGTYVPELAILHHVPANRLTRTYHRRWAFWRAVSQGVLDRERPEPVVYTLGIPRHRIGRALRSLAAIPGHLLTKRGKAQVFADELAAWDLVGFFYGRFLYRLPKAQTSQNQAQPTSTTS